MKPGEWWIAYSPESGTFVCCPLIFGQPKRKSREDEAIEAVRKAVEEGELPATKAAVSFASKAETFSPGKPGPNKPVYGNSPTAAAKALVLAQSPTEDGGGELGDTLDDVAMMYHSSKFTDAESLQHKEKPYSYNHHEA